MFKNLCVRNFVFFIHILYVEMMNLGHVFQTVFLHLLARFPKLPIWTALVRWPSKQSRSADVSPTAVQHQYNVELALDWRWTDISRPRLFVLGTLAVWAIIRIMVTYYRGNNFTITTFCTALLHLYAFDYCYPTTVCVFSHLFVLVVWSDYYIFSWLYLGKVVSRYYDTAGIRKKYLNVQTIEIFSINF